MSGDTTRRYDTVKRSADALTAALLLLVAAPILVGAALAIKLEDGGPVTFRQQRAGRDGLPFRLWKFRSMRVDTPPPREVGQVTGATVWVTRIGALLRRTRVDELPQLLNVLEGTMSLVGPRPDLVEHAAAYDAQSRERLLVRPGMTGWAQVNGNVQLSWPDRIVLDVWYVRHRSLSLDVRILLRTIGVVLFGERRDEDALARARAEIA